MKLIVAIVHARDKQKVCDSLLTAGHKFTEIATTGGFMRDGNVTLLIGAKKEQVDDVIDVIRNCCPAREQYVAQPPIDIMGAAGGMMSPIKVSVGGAIIFVVNVEKFERV